MDTLAQIYARHSGPGKFNDKGSGHSYIELYEELLAPYREKKDLNFIEIGLYDGHSFLMFKEYFKGRVFGIDIEEKPLGEVDLTPILNSNKLNTFILDGANEDAVERQFPISDWKWDIVIDDAAHTLQQQMRIYSVWKKRMKPDSLYIIEDIQEIDCTKAIFLSLGFRIIDRREINGRYDDVLAVIGGTL